MAQGDEGCDARAYLRKCIADVSLIDRDRVNEAVQEVRIVYRPRGHGDAHF